MKPAREPGDEARYPSWYMYMYMRVMMCLECTQCDTAVCRPNGTLLRYTAVKYSCLQPKALRQLNGEVYFSVHPSLRKLRVMAALQPIKQELYHVNSLKLSCLVLRM